jgi:hypothetical protein
MYAIAEKEVRVCPLVRQDKGRRTLLRVLAFVTGATELKQAQEEASAAQQA